MLRYIYHLPWPPSANHIWRNAKRTLLTLQARAWFELAGIEILKQGRPSSPIIEPVCVDITVVPASEVKRFDPDNYAKATIDALRKGHVLADDDWRIVRSMSVSVADHAERPGSVIVDIRAFARLYRRGELPAVH